MMFPTEIKLKASAVPASIYDAMTDGRSFSFKMTDDRSVRFFTAKAELADEPGLVRIFDIRWTPSIRLGDILPDTDEPQA